MLMSKAYIGLDQIKYILQRDIIGSQIFVKICADKQSWTLLRSGAARERFRATAQLKRGTAQMCQTDSLFILCGPFNNVVLLCQT